jgi:hypothetical protein
MGLALELLVPVTPIKAGGRMGFLMGLGNPPIQATKATLAKSGKTNVMAKAFGPNPTAPD